MNNGSIVIDGKTLKKEDYPLVFTPDGKYYKHSMELEIRTGTNDFIIYRFECTSSKAESYAVPKTAVDSTNEVWLSTILNDIPNGFYPSHRHKSYQDGNSFIHEYAMGILQKKAGGVIFGGTDRNGVPVYDGKYEVMAPDGTYITVTDDITEN